MSKTTYIFGGVAALAIIWTGGWFAGKSFIVEPQADQVVEELRSGDLFFSYDTRDVGGFPIAYDVVYRGVEVSDGRGWRWSAPMMSVGTGVTDAGALVITPSDESKLSLDAPIIGGAPDDAPMVMDIASEGLLITLRSGDAPGEGRVAVDAESFVATQAPGDGLLKGLVADLGGFDLDVSLLGPEADLDMSADKLRVAYRFSADGVIESYSDTTMENLVVSFATDMADAENLEAMIEQAILDGSITMKLEAASSSGTGGMTGGPSSPPVDVTASGGATSAEFSVLEGRIRYAAKADATVMSLEMGAPSPFPGGAMSVSGVELEMEVPMRKADGSQPYMMKMRMDQMQLDDAVWSSVDPSANLPRTPINLNIDFGGDALVLFEVGANTFGQTPLDVETLELRDISIDGLGVSALANGLLEISGDARQPEGDIYVEVTGAFALMDKATSAGLLPPGAGDLYKQLALSFARLGEGGDDHLVADISAKDGSVTVNGKPLQ